jgi:hypothetical protein
LLTGAAGQGTGVWLLTFDWLLSQTRFPELMQKMLKTVESAYRYPVDIEFTVNFDAAGTILNLVQCRRSDQGAAEIDMPETSKTNGFSSPAGTFRVALAQRSRIIFVDPEEYTRLSLPTNTGQPVSSGG